jgi:uncharacterized protein involved in exopolysaccharide biosynthesis
MTDKSSPERIAAEAALPPGNFVYVVQPDARGGTDGAINLLALWQVLWDGKWMILLSAMIFAAAGAAYSLHATPWYRAEVTLLPTESKSTQGLAGQLAQMGGLASLAGIDIGTGGKAEPLAVLQSRDFARSFIEDEKLLTVLMADRWDAEAGKWKVDGQKAPDIRDAVDLFVKQVRRVNEDRKTGLVLLTVEWTDANAAAAWANTMAKRLNDEMRERALADAAASVSYLQAQLATAGQVSLQQAIGRLLETELEKLMIARGRDEFAFRVIDKAEVPKKRFKPQRVLIVLGSAICGAIPVLALLLARGLRNGRERSEGRRRT